MGGHELTISGLLPLMMLHTKFGKDWPSSFWGEDVNARRKTDDAQRRTPTHSNRSPEWLRWPKKDYPLWMIDMKTMWINNKSHYQAQYTAKYESHPRSTIKAVYRKFIVLCNLKILCLYTGLLKFVLYHYLPNVAWVKSTYWGDWFDVKIGHMM